MIWERLVIWTSALTPVAMCAVAFAVHGWNGVFGVALFLTPILAFILFLEWLTSP